MVGYPVARLRISADAPAASLSVKLCDVFPDGTSALVTRGTLDLAFRDGVHGEPVPAEPGEGLRRRGRPRRLRLGGHPARCSAVSVAGADWPNTVAPPAPVTLTVHEAALELPVLAGDHPAPTFAPGRRALHRASAEGVAWEIHDDVLARTTTARDLSGVGVRHAVRRPRARGLPRRGLASTGARFAQRSARRHDLRPLLARRRRSGALRHGRSTSSTAASTSPSTPGPGATAREVSHRTGRGSPAGSARSG